MKGSLSVALADIWRSLLAILRLRRAEDWSEDEVASDYDHYEDYAGCDCPVCDGEGTMLVCWDDVCRGLGYCIHGSDGYAVCPTCRGKGDL